MVVVERNEERRDLDILKLLWKRVLSQLRSARDDARRNTVAILDQRLFLRSSTEG
jgi:hypothetical protein